MNWADYQRWAQGLSTHRDVTLRKHPQFAVADRIMMASLGVVSEVGEVIGYIRKVIYHNHPLQLGVLVDEIGDVLWNVSECASAIEIPIPLPSPRVSALPAESPWPMLLGSVRLAESTQQLVAVTNVVGSDYTQPLQRLAFEVALRAVLTELERLALLFELSLEGAADANVIKMKARYPDGFDPVRSYLRES